MKLLNVRNFLIVGGLAFMVLMGASYEARAQGRGRGQSKSDKKCAKFVNCHDASEGRTDGRGPRGGADDNDDQNWRRDRRDRDDDDRNWRRNRHERDDSDRTWRRDRDDRDVNNSSDHRRRRRHHRDRDVERNDNTRHRNRDRRGDEIRSRRVS